jgi:hypothetical protein
MRNQLKNITSINYKHLLDELVEKQDSNGYYTGEKVNVYGPVKQIRVVINFQRGKVYNEQFGLMYEYAASLQHTGSKVLVEGDLVWLQTDTSNDPDYIVKSVIPSLNSTLYHLIKKEA